MLKIGITGGIGSGKTTVSKIFEQFNIPVYNADQRAKYLMNHDQTLRNNITSYFGNASYDTKGCLNIEFLSNIVFNDNQAITKLNSLVHPVVHRDSEQWADSFKDKPYILREAALIFESGGDALLDFVITVFAPVEMRIKRVMDRDKKSSAEVQARIDNQMPEAEKIKRADFVIFNDQYHGLIDQVKKFHHRFLALEGSA